MIEIVATTISALLAAVGAAIILNYWETAVRDHVRIVRIQSSTDKPVEQIQSLYEELFPEEDGINYSREYIAQLMDPAFIDPRHVTVENIVLAALYKANVIGFLFCHYYPKPKKAIVSYYGLTQDRSMVTARAEGPTKLLVQMKKLLNKRDCEYLFFDLQRIDSSASQEERRKRKSRWQAFTRRARELGLYSGMFSIEYLCPKVSLEDGIHEEPFTLHCIPLNGTRLTEIPKEKMIDFLEFIYLYCYADYYPLDDPDFKAHQEYLESFVEHYRKTLPDTIQVVSR